MRRTGFLAVLLGLSAASYLAFRPSAPAPRPARPAPAPAPPARATSPPAAQAVPAAPAEALPESALRSAPDPASRRAAANALRSRALREPVVLARLASLLGDGAQPAELRESLAWILGSLEAPEALAALLQALSEPGLDPAFQAALLGALGQTPDARDLDDFFEPVEAPWMITTPQGLGVRICRRIGDRAALERLAAAVSHGAAEVRMAAVRSVRHSLEHEPARQALLDRLPLEPDAGVQAEAGDALAQWALSHPSEGECPRMLTEAALRPGAQLLRFRTAAELRQLPLADATREGLWSAAALGREEDLRRWALGILESHGGTLPAPDRGRLEALGRGILGDPTEPPKLREDAARLLEGFPESAEPLRRALEGDPAWHVRRVAAISLKSSPDPESRRALERAAASDPDARVREAAR